MMGAGTVAPGGVAQLGERLNGIQEVRGSIPLASMVETAVSIDLEEYDGELTAGLVAAHESSRLLAARSSEEHYGCSQDEGAVRCWRG